MPRSAAERPRQMLPPPITIATSTPRSRTSLMRSAMSRTTAGENLSAPELSRSSNELHVPAQECPDAHSPLSVKLHFGERKCAFAGGNDQAFVAAQNLSRAAIEVDNGRGKNFEILTIDFHERAWP